jgi:hypothetical protein
VRFLARSLGNLLATSHEQLFRTHTFKLLK